MTASRKPPRRESFLFSLGSAVLWNSLEKVVGLTKHVVIAGAIGLSSRLDVFYMAQAFMGILVYSWGGLLNILAQPRMVELWKGKRVTAFRSLVGGFLTLTLLSSLVVAACGMLLGRPLSSLALGFDLVRSQMLASSFPWLLPILLLHVPMVFLASLLRSIRAFSVPFQGNLLMSLAILACIVLFRDQPQVLLWSLGVGTSTAFLYLLFRSWPVLPPLGDPRSKEVRACFGLAPGLLVLQAAQYVLVLVDRLFVSFLPEGAVSALAYGLTLTMMLPLLLNLSAPFLTVLAEKKDKGHRAARLNDMVSLCVLLSVGAGIYLSLFGKDLVEILLQRGRFTAQDTDKVADALKGFSGMVLPLFLVGALDQVFQVEKKVGFMVRRTVLGVLVNAGLNAWFLFGLHWGVFGVALATTLGYWIMLLSGLQGMLRLGYRLAWKGHLAWTAWLLAGTAFLWVLFLTQPLRELGPLPRVLLGALATGVLLLASGLLYPGPEKSLLKDSLGRALSGIRRRLPS